MKSTLPHVERYHAINATVCYRRKFFTKRNSKGNLFAKTYFESRKKAMKGCWKFNGT